jgi:hypothetical protein
MFSVSIMYGVHDQQDGAVFLRLEVGLVGLPLPGSIISPCISFVIRAALS